MDPTRLLGDHYPSLLDVFKLVHLNSDLYSLKERSLRSGSGGFDTLQAKTDYAIIEIPPDHSDGKVRAGRFVYPYGSSIMYELLEK